MNESNSNNGRDFILGLIASIFLHLCVIVSIYYFLNKQKEKVVYVQAELWAGEQLNEVTKQESSNQFDKPVPSVIKKNDNRETDISTSQNNNIGLKKEKERKEKLAKQKKEKERKERLAKQRNDEMERLKNSMSSLNITDINQGGNNDKTLAGVSNGSDDGQRIGELANYSEQIRSKIRRKIVFDLTKIIENPRVVFKVIRKNGQYRQLEIVQRSGNPKWDFAVQDAIKQSIPLPDPPKEEIPIPPGELILTFTPRE